MSGLSEGEMAELREALRYMIGLSTRERAEVIAPTVERIIAARVEAAVAEREALVLDMVEDVYRLQCPVRSADTYVDRGALMAHKWWETVLGGLLRRRRAALASATAPQGEGGEQ